MIAVFIAVLVWPDMAWRRPMAVAMPLAEPLTNCSRVPTSRPPAKRIV